MHKYEIRLPNSVDELINISKIKGTYLRSKAIIKDMAKVKVAWKAHEDHKPRQLRTEKLPYLTG